MAYNRFDDQIFSKTNLTVSEVLSRKSSMVHQKLYDAALSAYKEESGKDESSYTFKELPTAYFDTPSKVLVIYKYTPFTKTQVDLTPYWPEYKFYQDNSKMKLSEDVIATSEIIYKDYVKGIAIIQSKLTSERQTVPLSLIDDTWHNAECMSLERNTFGYRIKNNIKY